MRSYLRVHPLRITFILLIAACVVLRMAVLSETDVFWYIRSGHLWLSSAHPDLTPVEKWDFSALGKTWLPNSYLWNIIITIVWDAGGLTGLSLFNGLAYALAIWLTWRILGRLTTPKTRYVITFLAAVGFFVYFTDRANTADVLILLLFTNLILKLRTQPHARVWISVTAFILAAVGENLHLSGLIYIFMFPAIASLLDHGVLMRDRNRTLILTGLTAAAGICVTPFGLTGIQQVLKVSDASRQLIVEWNPPTLTNLNGLAAILILLLTALMAVYLLYKHRLFETILLVILIALTCSAIRFGIYLIVLGVIIAALMPSLPTHLKTVNTRLTTWQQRLTMVGAALILICCGSVLTNSYLHPVNFYGVTASDFKYLPNNARVLSSPATGSAILLFRPDVQVAIDGRNDLLGAKAYGNVTNIYGYADAKQFIVWADKNKVDAVFVNKQDAAVREKMIYVGWKEYDTADGYTFVRTTIQAG